MYLTTEPEVRYFSGFLTQFWESPTRPFFLVVPDQGKPIAVVPEIAAALMRATWLDVARSWPSPQPDDEEVSLLAAPLRDIATGGAIGVLGGSETTLRMPLTDYRRRLRRVLLRLRPELLDRNAVRADPTRLRNRGRHAGRPARDHLHRAVHRDAACAGIEGDPGTPALSSLGAHVRWVGRPLRA